MDGTPAQLAYRVTCDAEWRTTSGMVEGWIADRSVDMTIERSPDGLWTSRDVSVPNLDDCVDLDLGFTPASNLLAIRRMALSVGQMRDAPAAWLDVATSTLGRLAQRYERRSETTYWYRAPMFGYEALLEVTADGFVRRYPGLWEAER